MKQLLAAFIVLLLSSAAFAGDIVGPATVVDGNTLNVGGTVVRLYGIQTPHPEQLCLTHKNKQQQCGRIAVLTLIDLVRGPDARCEDRGLDAQGRLQGVCFIGWMNVNEEMVAGGQALADPDTGGEFQRAETFAKARREGLWRTEFTVPWEWRGNP